VNEYELVLSLAEFAARVRADVKGLSSHVIWNLFGSDADYVHGAEESSQEIKTMQRIPKSRVDWETYVLLYGAGALQGHMTGAPERRGGGFTGKLEEKKEIQYIHQLLGNNCSALKAQCGVNYEALNARVALMVAEPHRTAAILFFQEYLRSIYRSVSGADAEILLEHLKSIPGDTAPEELFARWKDVEARLKSERRSAVYEIKDGKFHVFEKIGKTRRLVNGWLFGIETPEDAGGGPEVAGWNADFDGRVSGAAFFSRTRLVQAEAAWLLNDENEEALELVAESRSGLLSKILASAARFVELAESNMLKDDQKPIAKMIVERMEKIAATAARRSRLLTSAGIDTTLIKERNQQAQKLKRKI
jgi:hypothetical protein